MCRRRQWLHSKVLPKLKAVVLGVLINDEVGIAELKRASKKKKKRSVVRYNHKADLKKTFQSNALRSICIDLRSICTDAKAYDIDAELWCCHSFRSLRVSPGPKMAAGVCVAVSPSLT